MIFLYIYRNIFRIFSLTKIGVCYALHEVYTKFSIFADLLLISSAFQFSGIQEFSL